MPKYLPFFVSLLLCCSNFYSQESKEIELLLREDWQAVPAKEGLKWHIPRYITIHHTGTNQNPNRTATEKLKALQNFSFSEGMLGDGVTPKKPWPDVPYHFYISVDGTVAEGRELQFEGDSNTDYDLNGHALIVVEGNFQHEKIKAIQYEKLEKLVISLAKKYKIAPSAISGHKDQAQTTCPGEDLYNLLPTLKDKVGEVESPRVVIGAEQLFSPKYVGLLQGKKVGLITNHTGLLPDGTHLIDLLHNNRDVDLTLLFGPEHGLRGEEDSHVADGLDKKTNLPIISLYGKLRKPTKEMLNRVDVLVFDIQDIGARYYTYIKTMLNVLEAAAEEGIPFIVLDRPNPITGNYVEGPIGKPIDSDSETGIIPIAHGMTVGELARMFNGERKANGLSTAELTVIPLKNYDRSQWYDNTGLPWVKPSPNMLNINTAILYPATCLLEGTNYSEARGTLEPFEVLGAPWVDGEDLATKLNSYNINGLHFKPKTFIPDSIVDGIKIYPPKFLGENVEGVEIIITDRKNLKPARAGIYILHALLELYPDKFEWRNARMDGLLGTSIIREQLQENIPPAQIVKEWDQEEENFRIRREEFLLY